MELMMTTKHWKVKYKHRNTLGSLIHQSSIDPNTNPSELLLKIREIVYPNGCLLPQTDPKNSIQTHYKQAYKIEIIEVEAL